MASWDGKSRGSLLGYKIFVLTIKWGGVHLAYALLKIVSFYFFLFAKKPRKAIEDFYINALKMDSQLAKKTCRKNFRLIGQSIIDKVAFLSGKGDKYGFAFDGHDILVDLEKQGKGGILISGHVGNWDIAGNMLKSTDLTVPVNVVMFENEVQAIKKFMDQETGGNRFKVISIGNDLSHIIQINAALNKGEFVCIHGDRFVGKVKTMTVPFFGRDARFPAGPFEIAAKFKAPVTFVFNVKKSDFEYQLSATKPIREEITSAQDVVERYVDILEEKTRQYPEQWFNYYDFYNT
ncbi:MAG: lysophospholipid acyltransferase family protein [Flavobacteriales bacterium]|nr:lysophospholipid acyltransferase family protein [Flavobacteriales bacterium]